MTLVLTATMRHGAVMIADCLLSAPGRVTDEATKITVVEFSDARLLMGYTGLAASQLPAVAGRFRTVEWLADLVASCAPPDYTMEHALDRVVARMGSEFPPAVVGPGPHMLVVVLTGFQYISGVAVPIFIEIANVTVDAATGVRTLHPGFTKTVTVIPPDLVLMRTVGLVAAVKDIFLEWQATVAPARGPANGLAIVDQGVNLIRRAAAGPLGQGAIGGRCMSVILGPDRASIMRPQHHADVVGKSFFLPHFVDATGPGTAIYMDVSGDGGDLAGPGRDISYPRVAGHKPCPCGRPRRYRQCHGRVGGPPPDGYIEIGPYKFPIRDGEDGPLAYRVAYKGTPEVNERPAANQPRAQIVRLTPEPANSPAREDSA